MRTERYEEIRLYAEANDLQLIETTNQANGYPSYVEPALIGFASQEQLEKAKDELGGIICSFGKKDGWHLWHRIGWTYSDPYQLEPEDLGYIAACDKSDAEWLLDDIEQVMESLCEKVESLDTADAYALNGLRARMQNLKEVMSLFNRLKDDEVLMIGEDYIGCRNYDVIKAAELRPMSYYYDTQHHAKGLLFLQD